MPNDVFVATNGNLRSGLPGSQKIKLYESLGRDVVRLDRAGEAKKVEREVKSKVSCKVVLHFRQRSGD